MATRGHNNIAKNLRLFSVGYRLHKDGSQAILASHKSKFSLAVRVRQAPFKPIAEEKTHAPSGIPWCIISIGCGAEIGDHFCNNISQTKTSVWDLNWTFFAPFEA
jgi:hypothetical protein